ncbi:MAG: alpha/beta hydrolase [Clostridia bacterium]
MKEFKIKARDDYQLACYLFDDVENPKGILQITHGMAEHATRYARFAKFLNDNGYLVFANDIRAHGQSAGSLDRVGKVVKGDLFEETVQDQIFLTKHIAENFKELPIFLLGHSYGSFITQNYIQECQIPKAVILMGSANQKNFLTFAGRIIANLTCMFKGMDAPANMIANMSFGSYQKQFAEGEWITSDKVESDKYDADPYCGATFSAGFYKFFFRHIPMLYTSGGLGQIPKDYPIHIVSGAKDPVGGSGKMVQKLFDTYKKVGLTNVSMRLYDNMRHEVLNEIGYMEVYNDLLKYLNDNNK